MLHLTDRPNRRVLEVRYLGRNENPPDHTPQLIIVKTHGLDFELVAIASRHFRPVTLGSDATIAAALDRAAHAAEKFQVEIVYVVGAPKPEAP